MKVSIVIRTFNEERHLRSLLEAIRNQNYPEKDLETIVVDSGSTDCTLDIASEFPVRVMTISKNDFSFGRSLNLGCSAANGDGLVFISGHCIPASKSWISNLVSPLRRCDIAYTYGRQIGNGKSHFSECQIFSKYFPISSSIPQEGFYCNNANAALRKDLWSRYRFDESLTGLEDMHLSKRLLTNGYKIGYVSDAVVYHLHDESWSQIRRRFEREAIALQHIMPEVHLSRADVVRYFISAAMFDLSVALQQRSAIRNLKNIFLYRLMQFTGSYRGNHFHRQVSRSMKDRYFYPR